MSDLDLDDDDDVPAADRSVSKEDNSYDVTASELRQFIERVEQLEAEKKEVADQIKEVMAEAKGRGYDTKAMKKVIALRKRNRDEIAEQSEIIRIYATAVGMDDILAGI